MMPAGRVLPDFGGERLVDSFGRAIQDMRISITDRLVALTEHLSYRTRMTFEELVLGGALLLDDAAVPGGHEVEVHVGRGVLLVVQVQDGFTVHHAYHYRVSAPR